MELIIIRSGGDPARRTEAYSDVAAQSRTTGDPALCLTGRVGDRPPPCHDPRQGTRTDLPRLTGSGPLARAVQSGVRPVGIIWTIVIGFLAGVIAKFIMPGDRNEPSGFVMTTILGIVGAFFANFLGQSLGWYGPYDGAG